MAYYIILLVTLCALMTSSIVNALAFTKVPENRVIGINTTVSVPCQADGHPKPFLIWQKKKDGLIIVRGRSGLTRDGIKDRFSVEEDGTLTIVNVTKTDGGYYACVAMNDTWSISKVVMFNAMDLRVPTAAPSSVRAVRVGHQFIAVFWKPPPPQNPPVSIDGYKIQLYYKGRSKKDVYYMTYTILGNVSYGAMPDYASVSMLKISAYNRIGSGVESPMIDLGYVQTKTESSRLWEEMKPNVTAEPDSGDMLITWPPISVYEGNAVTSYKVEWRGRDAYRVWTVTQSYIRLPLPGNGRERSMYRVKPITHVTEGVWSQTVRLETRRGHFLFNGRPKM